jgi:NADPH-dependent 2,4-dienoyl-CoA reductase/sulfur reductase-like enzyme/nitrite reductase/ring-hydroxylating ferredoxin subunit
MTTEQTEPTGPDLTSGVDAAILVEGQPLLGHVGGEPVIVVRCEGEIYAVGGRCTHYSGPLEQGLVTGCVVRCPWHHAAFDVRTGEATRPPALNPLPTYPVVRRGERVFVGEKRERNPLAPVSPVAAPADAPRSVVIVGGGAAGSSASEQLRRLGYAGPILVIDSVGSEPVDRPNLSKDYLAGQAAAEWIPLRPPGFYQEHGIERLRDEVVRIDRDARTVSLAGGRTVPYDRLLLATGASPIVLELPGADLAHVRVLRTFEDAQAIAALAGKARHAVVIGSSFIGMEVAAALAARGITVGVVSLDNVPFEMTLGEELGREVQRRFEEHGVAFHLARKPVRIGVDDVELDDGSAFPADLVVVGVGVRPRLGLAQGSGLVVDGGVVVDEFLATSDPYIYAAGDIAAWPDPHSGQRIRVEHWVVAERQGQTAARNMLGLRQAFDAVPFFWTNFIGMDYGINYVGRSERGDEAIRPPGTEGVTRFQQDGRVHAVATVWNDSASLLAERALESGPLSS